MNDIDYLKSLIGKTVELLPLEGSCWNMGWLYYNEDMSESYRESPYVEIIGVEDRLDRIELTAKFHHWHIRYILPSWIKPVSKCLFL